MSGVIKLFNRIGYKANMPQEMIFLENFYKTQTLSCKKLQNSSFVDPDPQATVFTELPALIKYYIARWEHLNMFSSFSSKDFNATHGSTKMPDLAEQLADTFINSPKELLETIHKEGTGPLDE